MIQDLTRKFHHFSLVMLPHIKYNRRKPAEWHSPGQQTHIVRDEPLGTISPGVILPAHPSTPQEATL
jgi:hypothetical protein